MPFRKVRFDILVSAATEGEARNDEEFAPTRRADLIFLSSDPIPRRKAGDRFGEHFRRVHC